MRDVEKDSRRVFRVMGAGVGVLLLIATIALVVAAVKNYNADVARHDKMVQKHNDDIRLCRLRLGFDNEVLYEMRKLSMVCVHETLKGMPARGEQRSVLAEKAWNDCMPDLKVCDQALKETK